MATTAQQHMDERDQAAALGCLDVLCGASALLARHKAEVKGLLPTRGSSGQGVLERLMADLGEVLGTARGGTDNEEEEAVGGLSRPGSPSGRTRAKRAKRQQQQAVQAGRAQQQQQQQQAPSYLSVNRDPLSIEEVLERVMSFAEDHELLGRLSRVCRLWRRVSEGEELCMPVVRRLMPSALLGEEASLHAMLGGSARRCLSAYDGWQRPGQVLWGGAKLGDLRYMAEISYNDTLLSAECGRMRTTDDGELGDYLRITTDTDTAEPLWAEFSAASLGEADVHGIFTSGRLKVRYCVMDPATGVTACIYDGPISNREHLPEAGLGIWDTAQLLYFHGPMQMTSRTYGGPPLQAKLRLVIQPDEARDEDEEHLATIHLDRERQWWFGQYMNWIFEGQPGVYVEQFIRSRLAEEAGAMAANKYNGRW